MANLFQQYMRAFEEGYPHKGQQVCPAGPEAAKDCERSSDDAGDSSHSNCRVLYETVLSDVKTILNRSENTNGSEVLVNTEEEQAEGEYLRRKMREMLELSNPDIRVFAQLAFRFRELNLARLLPGRDKLVIPSWRPPELDEA